ncbi:nicotinate-nucleotide adenylyltransferase [Aminipila butyrica]|uniref:Probable nicotinate-nucleotide adenylyltransferase n=1 Tax=Aminipila butyrica TaxID=433296 RepID=A0A858BVK8_9FIRM|nr:nicotinate-nucleotide adenylyltransferase [Aminipila butyrica]QIB69452.1 nicotinate-nucleotide adenylyltransferase [Aminipila butyrica]
MNKIGIFGGTFDPVHLGHMGLAIQAKEELMLDRVIFIPAKRQPFKLKRKVAAEEDRVHMLRLALEEQETFEISYTELETDEISYTVNTLQRLKSSYGNTEVFFILGTDSFLHIELWHRAEELLTESSFAVGSRPGYKEEELKACIGRIQQAYNTPVMLLNNRELPISSTDIKKRIKKGQSIEQLVPTAVERYIYEKGLYR